MKFVKELLWKEYTAESTAAAENGKLWYLPDQGVYNRNKPSKICVLFD